MYDLANEHLAGYVAALVTLPMTWLFLRLIRLAATHRIAWAMRFVDGYRSSSAMTKTAVALMLVSAAVHLALAPGHLSEPAGILFVVDGAGLVGFSWAAFVTTWWRRPAALWLTANVLAYVVFVVAGWETPDQLGIACKLVELVALAMVLRLANHRRRTWPRLVWRSVAMPLLIVVTTAGIWIGGLAHPDALHAHAGAVLQPVASTATPAQQAAAARLLADTRASIARYRDPQAAIVAGFKPGPVSDAEKLLHFENPANAGAILDPMRPQALVYARTTHGLMLIGAMYQMPRPDLWGPDPGGPLTQWHQHEGICITPFGFELSFATPFWSCPVGAIIVTTPPMLHVWIVDNGKEGPFAADLDPKVQRLLERS
ncbi:MAG: hypothetical protein E6J01_05365 [Chloroflexi bacterium]|nr:MAG: hypothetical protein E6J01_05365 [Chloroflexota bacterium]